MSIILFTSLNNTVKRLTLTFDPDLENQKVSSFCHNKYEYQIWKS